MIWSLYADVDTGANNQHVALGLLLDHTLLRMYSPAKSYSCFFYWEEHKGENGVARVGRHDGFNR